MNMLREWIINILSVIIFVAFIEILVPRSNYRRYINVVIGLLVMIVILNPLIKLLNGGIYLGTEVAQASNELDYLIMKNRSNALEHTQKELVLQLYRQDLKKQIKNKIEGATKYFVHNINIIIGEEMEENFGMIKEIEIFLDIKKKEGGNIEIDVSINAKNNNTVKTQSIWISNEGEKFKKYFSELYNVPSDNIKIYVPNEE